MTFDHCLKISRSFVRCRREVGRRYPKRAERLIATAMLFAWCFCIGSDAERDEAIAQATIDVAERIEAHG